MKNEVEVAHIKNTEIIPISIVVPEPREFVRGGIAALVNIICTVCFVFLTFRYISYIQNDVSTATLRKWNYQCL